MSTQRSTVFVTVPKYVAITPSPVIKALKALPICKGSEYSSVSVAKECVLKGKKRRLDHLTWEEKIQRKKLKNRVAAQTSRDRKKARMEEMECEINNLTQKTEILQNKCESLQAINDSLLEKNHKLDMEIEILRQEMLELKEKQTALTTTNNAKSTNVLTCADSGITSNESTIDAGENKKEQHIGCTVEDSCTLPTLQDILLLDEEFDARKLEELAESLFAGITADMEAGNRTSDEITSEVAGREMRLSGSVVGTTTECLESNVYSTAPTQSSSIIELSQSNTDNSQESLMLHGEITLEYETEGNESENNNSNTNKSHTITSVINTLPSTPDTVYGRYDAKTNSITIVMDDDNLPVNEAVEEIYCNGAQSPLADDCIQCPSPAASLSQVQLGIECSDNDGDDDDNDPNFDPFGKFLCPKRTLKSPLAKSPLSLHSSIASDHGYESIIGSPTAAATDIFETSVGDFMWNNSSFNELFPTLI